MENVFGNFKGMIMSLRRKVTSFLRRVNVMKEG